MPTKKLTEHLLSLSTSPPYSAAVSTHPFLVAASNGTLSDSLLSLWLSQDRIYAGHAYPRFIGSLIANIPYDGGHGLSSSEEKMNQRILKTLVYSLDNIVREVGFFEEVAQRWGLDMEGWGERKGTRDYTAEMARIAGNRRIEDGLVFLWAMEKVYLEAWTSVHGALTAKFGSQAPVGDSAVMLFATNWSSPEFVQFVDDLGELVDEVCHPEEWSRAEEIWRRVIELEEGFWPKVVY